MIGIKKRHKIKAPRTIQTSFSRKVYHGTPVYFSKPDTKHSQPPTDFGTGFYTTPVREYAVDHVTGNRGCEKYSIIEYEFYDDVADKELVILKFNEGEEWLKFVLWNRKNIGTNIWPDYDIAIGPSADDGISDVVAYCADCVARGEEYDPQEVIAMFKTDLAEEQILFHSERSLSERYLKEVRHDNYP